MKSLQVTIGAAVTQFTTADIPVRHVIVQNTAAAVMRVGDASTTSSIGLSLAAASTPVTIAGPYESHNDNLKNFWVAGTNTQVLDVLYET